MLIESRHGKQSTLNALVRAPFDLKQVAHSNEASYFMLRKRVLQEVW